MNGIEENSEVQFSDEQVAAARAMAEEDAERVCAFLKIKNRVQVPLEILTDFAAALRIGAWQKNGLLKFLTSRPELATEFLEFMTKATTNGVYWSPVSSGPLSRQVFVSWVRNFAWSAPKELGAECLLQATADVSDEEIEAIAKMLWQLKRPDSRN